MLCFRFTEILFCEKNSVHSKVICCLVFSERIASAYQAFACRLDNFLRLSFRVSFVAWIFSDRFTVYSRFFGDWIRFKRTQSISGILVAWICSERTRSIPGSFLLLYRVSLLYSFGRFTVKFQGFVCRLDIFRRNAGSFPCFTGCPYDRWPLFVLQGWLLFNYLGTRVPPFSCIWLPTWYFL